MMNRLSQYLLPMWLGAAGALIAAFVAVYTIGWFAPFALFVLGLALVAAATVLTVRASRAAGTPAG